MGTPTALSRRIAQRVNADIVAEGFAVDPRDCFIRRTHAGRHQRAGGSWTWELAATDGGPPPPLHVYVGSIYRAREIASAARIGWVDNCGHIELYPERDDAGRRRREAPRWTPAAARP